MPIVATLRVTEPLFSDVTDTAGWIAAYRAIESARVDALFRDRLADRLAGPQGRRLAKEVVGAESFEWMAIIRTCVVDELIEGMVASGVDTVLNLGAGMDTRPYRLKLPNELRWIEVDQARIVDVKNERLRGETPACDLERVSLDLSEGDGRRRMLARVNDSCRRGVVLTEGVIGYLTNDDAAALARELHACAHLRIWIVDYMSPFLRFGMSRRRQMKSHFQNAPFRFDPRDWEGFFRDAGWKRGPMRYLVEEGERRGRPIPLPRWLPTLAAFVPWLRREIRQMAAFTTLERFES